MTLLVGIALAAWVAVGIGHWAYAVNYVGAPHRWKSQGRDEGWDVLILVYLPLSVILGPLGIGLLYIARRNAARHR
jgi:hypothetical protein